MHATLNGIRIYYEETGPPVALPVVFVHAFPLSHEMWRAQLQALQPRYRAIACDLRGFGQSEAGDGQYTLEFFVDDLLALLDHLRIERAVLCGLSMGGYIVLRTAERNPERLRGLVLCDTRSEADSNEARLKRTAALKTIKQQGLDAFAEGFVKAVLAPVTLSQNPQLVETIKHAIRRNSPTGVCGALLAMASRTDTTASLSNIRVPTLLLVGEHDPLTPPAVARAMQQKIAGSTVHVIPAAGHLSNLENPAEFNRRLLEFLETLG
jgi:3-oxoadipate enol-lactonase